MIELIPQEYPFPDYEPLTRAAVVNTCIKMKQYFREHDNILISVSGGSDSDCIIHLICKYFPEYVKKCRFVFVNTGLEYLATKKHIEYLESRYHIQIDKIRGLSVVTAVKKYGVPILSKTRSDDIHYYLCGKPWAVSRIDGTANENNPRYAYTKNMIEMIHYIKKYGVAISPRCCYFSKKSPIRKFMKTNKIDLNVTGERKAENGQRASQHKSCFEIHKDGVHKYMPLWWWSNYVKNDFKKCENIRFSECYELWGMKRTGCVGCPFNLNIADDLYTLYIYEPKLFMACIAVFGKSYYLMDKFNTRRKKCISPELETVLNYPEYVELWDKIKRGVSFEND